MSSLRIEYIQDGEIDSTLDQQLRDLLCACFNKPHEVEIFSRQRFFNEQPQHRWLVRDAQVGVVAHLALHEKQVKVGNQVCLIGGVAEVCVRPGFRGRGLVSRMIQQAHRLLATKGIEYSVLYGSPEIYSSSGYRRVANLHVVSDREDTAGQWLSVPAMVCVFGEKPWPEQAVYLPGKTF